MSVFKASFINEMERMLRKRKIIIFIILDIAICLLSILIINLLKMSANINIGTINMSTNILSLFCQFVLPIYIMLEAMEIFSAEYMNKTITNILIRPISRFKIYLSKIAALCTFIMMHLIILFFTTRILNLSSNINIARLAFAFFISVYPLTALSIIIALISQIIKNGFLGMLFSMILLLGLKAMEIFFTVPSAFVFTKYLNWYKLFTMNALSLKHITVTFLLITAYSIFAFTLGFILFERKEF